LVKIVLDYSALGLLKLEEIILKLVNQLMNGDVQ